MKTKLQLNQQVTLADVTYKVIGIDNYSLINVLSNKKTWTSYTLIDNKKNKTWISYGQIPNYFIQWFLISEEEFKQKANGPLNFDLSGVTNIAFDGNPGFSTPVAEHLWFNLSGKEYDFYVIEQFIQTKGDKVKPMKSYYDAGKILIDFKPE